MDIAFIGSSLVSAMWNGAATYYRGIIRALAARGHRVSFYEPDAYNRQQHRDIDDPPWARVVVWPATAAGLARTIEAVRSADLVVKASGVGVFDAELEAAVADMKDAATATVFWDVDAPATLDRVQGDPDDRFGDFPRFKWEQLADHLPADLTGWTALDIGCNAGSTACSWPSAARGSPASTSTSTTWPRPAGRPVSSAWPTASPTAASRSTTLPASRGSTTWCCSSA